LMSVDLRVGQLDARLGVLGRCVQVLARDRDVRVPEQFARGLCPDFGGSPKA
jgi:hypothetical protein